MSRIINLSTPESGVTNGMELSFKAPCMCTDVEGVRLDNKIYKLVDASGGTLASCSNYFEKNAMLTVVIDTTNATATLLNPNVNNYTKTLGLPSDSSTGTTVWAKVNSIDKALSNKAPSVHKHTKSEITDFAHNHDDRYYTESEINVKLNGKSDSTHNHDDRYYTESEIDTKLSSKSNTTHNHDNRYYTETEIDDKLTAYSNKIDALDAYQSEISNGTTSVPRAMYATDVDSKVADGEGDRHVWFSQKDTETKRAYDDDFTYNPKTNTLKVTNVNGNAATATEATKVQGTSATADADRHVWFSRDNDETQRVYNDNFTYNPGTKTLNVKNIAGNAATATSADYTTHDSIGRVIKDVYATKLELTESDNPIVVAKAVTSLKCNLAEHADTAGILNKPTQKGIVFGSNQLEVEVSLSEGCYFVTDSLGKYLTGALYVSDAVTYSSILKYDGNMVALKVVRVSKGKYKVSRVYYNNGWQSYSENTSETFYLSPIAVTT